MDEIFNNLINVFPDPQTRTNVLVNMFSSVGYNPNTQQLVPTDDEQSATYIRCYICSYIAYTVPYIEFTSSQQATDLIKTLKPIYEAALTDTTLNIDTFSWLARIYSKAIADISSRGSQLPSVNSFICEMMPACVVAQYLYQDGSRSDEIIIRNNDAIQHPMFCDTTLEVLSK